MDTRLVTQNTTNKMQYKNAPDEAASYAALRRRIVKIRNGLAEAVFSVEREGDLAKSIASPLRTVGRMLDEALADGQGEDDESPLVSIWEMWDGSPRPDAA